MLPTDNVPMSTNSPNGKGTQQPKPGELKRKYSGTYKPRKRIRVKDGKPMHDNYCWICRKTCEEKFCSFCPRVYHEMCSQSPNEFSTDNACSECQMESISRKKLPFYSSLKEILWTAVKRVYEKEGILDMFIAWPDEALPDTLCYVVDRAVLLDKVEDIPYRNTGEFFSDVKWMHHNTCIVYGDNAPESLSAKKIVKDFKKEILDMEACFRCYYYNYTNPDYGSLFTELCSTPHTLVWAKLKGFPYWPAKCLRIDDFNADVRFFGTHDKSRVPVSNCRLMSIENPLKADIKRPTYLNSIRELKKYIENYEKIYGKYIYAPTDTGLVPIDGRQRSKSRKKKVRAKSGKPFIGPLRDFTPAVTTEDNGEYASQVYYATTDAVKKIPLLTAENSLQSVSEGPVMKALSSKSVVCLTFSAEESTNENNAEKIPTSESELTFTTVTTQDAITNSVDAGQVFHSLISDSNIAAEMVNIKSSKGNSMNFEGNTDANVRTVDEEASIVTEVITLLNQSDKVNLSNNDSLPSTSSARDDVTSLRNDFDSDFSKHKELRQNLNSLFHELYAEDPFLYKIVVESRTKGLILDSCHSLEYMNKYKRIVQVKLGEVAKVVNAQASEIRMLKEKVCQLCSELEKEKGSAKQREDQAGYLMCCVKKSILRETEKYYEASLKDKSTIIEEKDKIIEEKDKIIIEKEMECAELTKKLQEQEKAWEEKLCKSQTDLENTEQMVLDLNAEYKKKMDAKLNKKDQELNDAVLEAKRADWCVKCLQPASIYCCMGTYYCSSDCQENDIKTHENVCRRNQFPFSQSDFMYETSSVSRNITITIPPSAFPALSDQVVSYPDMSSVAPPAPMLDQSAAGPSGFHNVSIPVVQDASFTTPDQSSQVKRKLNQSFKSKRTLDHFFEKNLPLSKSQIVSTTSQPDAASLQFLYPSNQQQLALAINQLPASQPDAASLQFLYPSNQQQLALAFNQFPPAALQLFAHATPTQQQFVHAEASQAIAYAAATQQLDYSAPPQARSTRGKKRSKQR